MDNSNDTVLTKRVASRLEITVAIRPAAMFSYYVYKLHHLMQNHVRIKMAASKGCRRNDGQVMARFLPRCSEKYGREIKMKDLNPAEEGDFPCKLR